MSFLLSQFQLTFVVVALYAEGLAYKYVCTICMIVFLFSSSYPFPLNLFLLFPSGLSFVLICLSPSPIKLKLPRSFDLSFPLLPFISLSSLSQPSCLYFLFSVISFACLSFHNAKAIVPDLR